MKDSGDRQYEGSAKYPQSNVPQDSKPPNRTSAQQIQSNPPAANLSAPRKILLPHAHDPITRFEIAFSLAWLPHHFRFLNSSSQ